MSNGALNKIKASISLTFLPLALARLLESKGIITEDELSEAMTKTLADVSSRRKAIKRKKKITGGEGSGK